MQNEEFCGQIFCGFLFSAGISRSDFFFTINREKYESSPLRIRKE